MKLKYFFAILSALLLLILSILTYLSISEGGWLFYIMQGIVLVSFIFLSQFYQKLVKPLQTIGNGMDLLREQDFSSRLGMVGQYETDRIVTVFNKMMDQLKRERLYLREQNHFLDLLIEASPMGVIVLDFDHKISSLNSTSQQFIGMYMNQSACIGKRFDELNSPLAAELSQIALNDTRTLRLSDSSIYKCTHSSFIDQGFQHSFFLIESLTVEVIKAEKKAYEQVIRMIAHEVNNTTAGVTSTLDSLESILTEMDDTADMREVIRVCIDRSMRMSEFITNFAEVVKIPVPQKQEVDINDLLRSCSRFMETICQTRDITLKMELSDQMPNISADPVLFEQVLLNIIKNSAESIEQTGTITITTTHAPLALVIADNGNGITKSVEAKLFSPFFSTKPNGQGIGLIFIREVLTQHQFPFTLRTEADDWTRFRIHLTES